jgi:hypothetical protein
MLTYLGDSLRQFVLGALEFLAPVFHLDGINCIHPARIERLEVLHATLHVGEQEFTLLLLQLGRLDSSPGRGANQIKALARDHWGLLHRQSVLARCRTALGGDLGADFAALVGLAVDIDVQLAGFVALHLFCIELGSDRH